MKDTGIEEKVNGLFAPIRADNKLSAKMAQIGEKFLPTLRDRTQASRKKSTACLRRSGRITN